MYIKLFGLHEFLDSVTKTNFGDIGGDGRNY